VEAALLRALGGGAAVVDLKVLLFTLLALLPKEHIRGIHSR
jgi:hypothetical protein